MIEISQGRKIAQLKHVFLSILISLTFTVIAQGTTFVEGTRLHPIHTNLNTPKTLAVSFNNAEQGISERTAEGARGSCPSTPMALTDHDFGPGQIVVQAGFAQGEILAATYNVPANEFPIKIDIAEVMFATSNTTVQTTTKWSVYMWDGTPTNGTLVAHYSSDNIILPHLVMPPGTSGMIISVSVSPDDPEQVYIYNDSGQNSYTIGFGIDQHNNPGDPCISSPPTNSNAFPTTDTDGLQFPQDNWIDAVTGAWCVCGEGWFTFQNFPSICTPSGDWVVRSAYTAVNCTIEPSACCIQTECYDLTPGDCEAMNGISQDQGTSCASYICGEGEGACCIEVTGACVEFDVNTCYLVDGIHMGEGTLCAEITCFPEGACCLANGNCISPVSPVDCSAVGGDFQGNATNCNSANCPQPVGACCGDGFCLNLSEDKCLAVAGNWSGMDTTCESPAICGEECPEDINGDGIVDVNDLLAIVGGWGSNDPDLDIDGNGVVDTDDLLAVIAVWGSCE